MQLGPSLTAFVLLASSCFSQMTFFPLPGSWSPMLQTAGGRLLYDSSTSQLLAVLWPSGAAARPITPMWWNGTGWTTGASQWPPASSQTAFDACFDRARNRLVVVSNTSPFPPTSFHTLEMNAGVWTTFVTVQSVRGLTFDSNRQQVVGIAGQQLVAWNGASWSSIVPVPATVLSLVFDEQRSLLLAVDQFGVHELHGSAWQPVANPPPGLVAFPVYDHHTRSVLFLAGAVRYDGTNWIPAPYSGSDFYHVHGIASHGAAGQLWTLGLFGLSLAERHPNVLGATSTWYGQACSGPVGEPAVNVHQTNYGTNQPALGTTIVIDLANVPPLGLGYPYIFAGFTNQSYLGQPLPLDLTVHGFPGCQLLVDPEFTFLQPSLTVNIPANRSYLGSHVYFQGAVLGFNWGGAYMAFSRAVDCTLGVPW